MATVISTTPRPAPRCPPVTETAEIVSSRNSSASWRNWSLARARSRSGVWTVSRSGVGGRSVIGIAGPCRPPLLDRPAPTVDIGSGAERSVLVAVAAAAADLHHRPDGGDARLPRRRAAAYSPAVAGDMGRLSASVADEEDAVVEAVGMLVGDIGDRKSTRLNSSH